MTAATNITIYFAGVPLMKSSEKINIWKLVSVGVKVVNIFEKLSSF